MHGTFRIGSDETLATSAVPSGDDEKGVLCMRRADKLLGLLIPILAAFGPDQAASADERDEPKRMVLVELYTSQGCDMCPTAEKMLGALAERDRRIVPIAFHVDYFNEPWKDVFSDPLYSQRQMAYNQLYTKPKNRRVRALLHADADDRRRAVGQRPRPAPRPRRRSVRPWPGNPPWGSTSPSTSSGDGLSGTATIKVTSRSARAEKSPLLVCAVLREDGVVTDVPSGENAGKSLVARFPARQTKYEFIELDGKSPATQRFTFAIEPAWNRQNLRLAVFVQDKRTGVIHQATDLPWRSTSTAAAPRRAKAGRGTH